MTIDWQPMSTAPKDRRILVYNPAEGVYSTLFHRGEWPCCESLSDNPFAFLGEDPNDGIGYWFCVPIAWAEMPTGPACEYDADGRIKAVGIPLPAVTEAVGS